MDKNKKQHATTIIPASTWECRLAFKIRKRGFITYNDTSLLIINDLGVWSVRRRRYIKKKRFHRFTQLRGEALPVERRYASLQKLGMHSWPGYDKQIVSWRSRLIDIYWDAAPAWYREDVIDYFCEKRRLRKRDWWEKRFICVPISLGTIAVTTFLLVKQVFLWERLDWLLFIVVCILEVIMWCIILYKEDDSVLSMLEILDEGYVKEILE